MLRKILEIKKFVPIEPRKENNQDQRDMQWLGLFIDARKMIGGDKQPSPITLF
jgi:hypothetical protein